MTLEASSGSSPYVVVPFTKDSLLANDRPKGRFSLFLDFKVFNIKPSVSFAGEVRRASYDGNA
jgi:hypothetical protein